MIGIFTIICIFESFICLLRRNRYKKKKNIVSNKNQNVKIFENVKRDSYFGRFRGKIIDIFDDFTFLFFKIVGYVPIHFVRIFFYKYIFWMSIGKKAVIYYGLETRDPWKISIGSGSIIGDHCILDGRSGVIIGKNVNFSNGVWVWTLQHDINSANFNTKGQEKIVEVRDRSWISCRVTLLPGTIVGEGTVVAAGAVVPGKELAAFSLYGGVPAKFISNRSKDITYIFSGKHRHFL